MPAHLLYLLLPLNVGCFAVLKRLYGQRIEEYMRNGVNHIDKQDFLNAYYFARIETMNTRHICSSFAAAGLVSYDPERVLSKLHIRLRTPTPLPIPTVAKQANWVPETPYNTAELEL
jgi:hypothetical protein